MYFLYLNIIIHTYAPLRILLTLSIGYSNGADFLLHPSNKPSLFNQLLSVPGFYFNPQLPLAFVNVVAESHFGAASGGKTDNRELSLHFCKLHKLLGFQQPKTKCKKVFKLQRNKITCFLIVLSLVTWNQNCSAFNCIIKVKRRAHHPNFFIFICPQSTLHSSC